MKKREVKKGKIPIQKMEKKITKIKDSVIKSVDSIIENIKVPLPENRTKTLKEKLFRRDINFRISKKAKWQQRFKFGVNKHKKELDMKESQNVINIVHISEDGDVYLIPAYQSSRNINYKADKTYRKKYNHSKRISIHYFDGKTEEGLLCDSFSPMNYKVNPSLEKCAIHAKEEFENAYETFEKDLLRSTAFSFSSKQIKTLIVFFIAGIGFGSLFWGGAFVITIM